MIRRSSGFTILELIIVFVVVTVVAGLAVPAFFERSEVTLDKACDLLARDLRLAQNRAAFHRTPVFLKFREDGDGYEVHWADGTPLPHPVDPEAQFLRRYSIDAVFEGVTITHISCGDDEAIEYRANGFTDDGGFVILGFRDDARILYVKPERGDVHVLGRPAN